MNTTLSRASRANALKTPEPPLADRLSATLLTWRQRSRTRQCLKKLTADELCDVGLSPKDALNEAEKPFWR